VIPLYGFLEGDTIGLLMLATADEPVGAVMKRLAQAASVRVAPCASLRLMHEGREVDPTLSVGRAGLKPLDRIDVVRGAPS
jgi:hypothetical protein